MANEIKNGDNLHHLREMVGSSVDLVYLDPPFNSGRDYGITVEDSMAHELAYEDTWTWGPKARETLEELNEATFGVARKVADWLNLMRETLGGCSLLAYLAMMAPRLIELHRVLRSTGSLYLHCDPTASHYLKVVLDLIFGSKNFRGEIIWKRTSAHNNAKRPGPIHDVILFYTKSDKYTWNKVCHDVSSRATKETPYQGQDEFGKWVKENLTAAGARNGSSGQSWRNYDLKNRHWAIPNSLREDYEAQTGKPLEKGTTQEQLDQLHAAGLIIETGTLPGYKKYVDRGQGVPLQDIWNDIAPIKPQSDENEAFDGQKPTALLDRIIRASSNEGDHVLDPFLGSGTTAIAAQRLKRQWTGIDLTDKASQLARNRLDKEFGEGVYLEFNNWPADVEHAKKLAESDHYAFSCWVVKQLHGIPTNRGGDGGVDGNFTLKGFADNKSRRGLIQVKGGGATREQVKSFCKTLERNKACVGLFVAFEASITSGMKEEANQEGTFTTEAKDDPRRFAKIQIIPVENLFNRALDLGGAKLPGFVKKPDYSQTKEAEHRRQLELANLAFELDQE